MLFVKNLTKSKIDENFLERVAENVLKNLPRSKNNSKKNEIDLVIVGEKRMQNLNLFWRKKNKATDVLSFGNEEGNQKLKFIIPAADAINLGQIFICYPVMAKQAKQLGYSRKEEMSRLLVHGILHLAGYDHEKSIKEDKRMMDLQEKILNKINK
jgi:probable rRNA maturation factor